MGAASLDAPPTQLSCALLPTGAHTRACSQRSARNPKQLSWVGRGEGPAVFGTRNSSLEPGYSHMGPEKVRQEAHSPAPLPGAEIKNVLCVFRGGIEGLHIVVQEF